MPPRKKPETPAVPEAPAVPKVTGRKVTVKHRDTGKTMTVSKAYYEKYAHKLEVVSE